MLVDKKNTPNAPTTPTLKPRNSKFTGKKKIFFISVNREVFVRAPTHKEKRQQLPFILVGLLCNPLCVKSANSLGHGRPAVHRLLSGLALAWRMRQCLCTLPPLGVCTFLWPGRGGERGLSLSRLLGAAIASSGLLSASSPLQTLLLKSWGSGAGRVPRSSGAQAGVGAGAGAEARGPLGAPRDGGGGGALFGWRGGACRCAPWGCSPCFSALGSCRPSVPSRLLAKRGHLSRGFTTSFTLNAHRSPLPGSALDGEHGPLHGPG